MPHSGIANEIFQITANSAAESDVRIEGDAAQRLHISYMRGNNLYYQCRACDGTSLIPEELAACGAAYSLAVDPAGNPQVVCVSSGTVYYAVRTNGAWTSAAVGTADSASLAIMNDGQAYVACAKTAISEQGGGRSSIWLARIETNALVPFHVVAAGYETNYMCLGRSASEHHDYNAPMLRCSDGVFHVVGRHVRTRDAYIEHAVTYCIGETQVRLGYWRYDWINQTSSFSDVSPYLGIYYAEPNFTLLSDGQPQLAYSYSNGAWMYASSLAPWIGESLSSGMFTYSTGMRPIDASSRGVVGLLTHNFFGPPLLHLRVGGVFSAGTPVYAQAIGSDLCLDLSAIAFIRTNETNSADVYLLVDLDSDGDGLPDRDEQVAGTDPFDRDSLLKWERVVDNPDDGTYALGWHGVANRRYTLHVTTNGGFSWTNLAAYTDLPGQNAFVAVSNLATGLSQAWVRVGVQVDP